MRRSFFGRLHAGAARRRFRLVGNAKSGFQCPSHARPLAARLHSAANRGLREPTAARHAEARSAADALEIDGTVFVDEKLPVGEFAEVTVTGHKDYDLIAR